MSALMRRHELPSAVVVPSSVSLAPHVVVGERKLTFHTVYMTRLTQVNIACEPDAPAIRTQLIPICCLCSRSSATSFSTPLVIQVTGMYPVI